MSDIDDIFNEMEVQVISNGSGWSSLILNVGMVLVIAFSTALWVKMSKYETKNA